MRAPNCSYLAANGTVPVVAVVVVEGEGVRMLLPPPTRCVRFMSLYSLILALKSSCALFSSSSLRLTIAYSSKQSAVNTAAQHSTVKQSHSISQLHSTMENKNDMTI